MGRKLHESRPSLALQSWFARYGRAWTIIFVLFCAYAVLLILALAVIAAGGWAASIGVAPIAAALILLEFWAVGLALYET